MEPSSLTQRFFVPGQLKSEQQGFVACGQEGNSLFKAAAVSLIDTINHAARIDDQVLRSILNPYFEYFPQFRDTRGLLTPQERYNALKKQLHIPELVETLAYVLRQLAVNEMLQQPEKYPMLFLHSAKRPSIESLRSEDFPLNEYAIHALSNALALPCRISISAENKELPLTITFNQPLQSIRKPVLKMALLGQQVRAKVNQPEIFSALSNRKAKYIKPMDVKSDVPSYESALTQYMDSLWKTYQRMLHSLQAAVMAQEVSKEQLLSRYMSAVPSLADADEYLRGSEELFKLIRDRKETEPPLLEAPPVVSQEALLIEELCKALARMVSVGQLEEDELYEEHAAARL